MYKRQCTYYACNFGLKPSQVMQKFKAEMTAAGIRPKKEVCMEADNQLAEKKLPVSRLVARLGLEEYDVAAPMKTELLKSDTVDIPLKMHVGAPAVPVVRAGERVQAGTLIADIREKALGAKIHASITGVVDSVDEDRIRIRSGK